MCLNRLCVNPCTVANPCAPTAECQALNHKAVCRCPENLIGDPFLRCYESKTLHFNKTLCKTKIQCISVPKTQPECTSDSDCSDDKACINQRCQNPCALSNPCGTNAECRTSQHRPTCRCPDGWGGNPQVLCYKRKLEIKTRTNGYITDYVVVFS